MKLGVRECCDVVLKAKSTQKLGNRIFKEGEPVIYFDTVTTSSMEGAATTVYAQGGKGNSRLLAWEGEKTLTFTMEDALISTDGIAILTGAGLIQADANNIVTGHITVQGKVSESEGNVVLTIKNAKKPSENQDATFYMMLLDPNGEMSGIPVALKASDTNGYAFDDTTKVLTIKSSLLKEGDRVLLDYYSDFKSDAVEIDITPDKFAGYYYLEGSTLFRRQLDGADLPAEIIIPKVKIQSNFTFTMASSGDPTTFTFTMDAFPDYTRFSDKKVLAAIQVLGADDNYDDVLAKEEERNDTNIARYYYDEDGQSKSNKNAAYINTVPMSDGDKTTWTDPTQGD